MADLDAVVARQLAVLQWFVIRARRVEEHSLTQDSQQLQSWAQATFTLSGVEGQPFSEIRWDLPPEETLDSLAARCRPFIAKSDSIYWSKVVGALGFYIRGQDDVQLASALDTLRRNWREVDRDTPGSLGFESRAGGENGELGEIIGSKTLAYTWLYGDLVHADDNIPKLVCEHDIDERYRAGAILITRVAICVIQTLDAVRALRSRGIVELPDAVFEQRVIGNPDATLTISNSVTAPVGTSAAALDEALDKLRDHRSPEGPS